ncbi:MAG TPA: hypothetical protein VM935_14290 [Chitinophagaceae bacterium]|jgi:hypothetical protein|nr:hypothetical protein [Chitinophagaceae bacterium]
MTKQPWIGKPLTDIIFILSPPFISLLVIFLFPAFFQNNKSLPDVGWVVLILLIDVAHVYSTLYRTYLDPQALRDQRSLLWTIPFTGFVVGVLLYSISDFFYWRLLAYVAVFHFVRQQYGFMRLYSRKENREGLLPLIDKIIIYYATLYPLLFWHLKGDRNFNWFVEGDFVMISMDWLLMILSIIYFIIIALYVLKEIYVWIKFKTFNIPKFSIITGTTLSWYFGIVYFNGDMAFTLLNVVSHGIPYMALVWLYGRKQNNKPGHGSRFLKLVFNQYGILVFLGLVFLLAFIEEGLWDLTVWKEHKNIFRTSGLQELHLDDSLLSIIVPLLTLPQITHYVLDGFIWKIRQDEFKGSKE